jgi:hypothetical protein
MDINVEYLSSSTDVDLLRAHASIQGASNELGALANAARRRLADLAQLKHEADGNQVAAQRDAAAAAAHAAESTAAWEHAIHRHVRDLLILYADHRHGKDSQRRRAHDALRASLADAMTLLWPE